MKKIALLIALAGTVAGAVFLYLNRNKIQAMLDDVTEESPEDDLLDFYLDNVPQQPE